MMLDHHRRIRLAVVTGAASLLLVACTQTPRAEQPPVEEVTTEPVVSTSTEDAEVVLYRSPTCTCCHGHAEHLEAAGYTVRSEVVDDVRAVKEQLGVPAQMESCHTSVVGGYFVEGHMPADVIDQLLDERPAVDGIALPGMPAGSPGMSGQQDAPFVIHSVTNGRTALYATR
jgi:hypothetical protein